MTETAVDRYVGAGDPFASNETAVQLVLALEGAGAITPTRMMLDNPDMPYERYEALGGLLGRVKRSTSWWIGDWLLFGEGVYGERYAQAEAATGLSEDALLRYAFVCRSVAPDRRRVELSFGCHHAVASMVPREQTTWLKRAVRHGWSERDLRREIREAQQSGQERQEQMFDTTPASPPEAGSLAEVAYAILRDARQADDPSFWLVPAEDMARLRAALGQE